LRCAHCGCLIPERLVRYLSRTVVCRDCHRETWNAYREELLATPTIPDPDELYHRIDEVRSLMPAKGRRRRDPFIRPAIRVS
jgi:hypothetical protein